MISQIFFKNKEQTSHFLQIKEQLSENISEKLGFPSKKLFFLGCILIFIDVTCFKLRLNIAGMGHFHS